MDFELTVLSAIGVLVVALIISSWRASRRIQRETRNADLAEKSEREGVSIEALLRRDVARNLQAKNDAFDVVIKGGCWLSAAAGIIVAVGYFLHLGWSLF